MSPRTPRGAAPQIGTYGTHGTKVWRRGRPDRQPPTANRQPQTANALTANPFILLYERAQTLFDKGVIDPA